MRFNLLTILALLSTTTTTTLALPTANADPKANNDLSRQQQTLPHDACPCTPGTTKCIRRQLHSCEYSSHTTGTLESFGCGWKNYISPCDDDEEEFR